MTTRPDRPNRARRSRPAAWHWVAWAIAALLIGQVIGHCAIDSAAAAPGMPVAPDQIVACISNLTSTAAACMVAPSSSEIGHMSFLATAAQLIASPRSWAILGLGLQFPLTAGDAITTTGALSEPGVVELNPLERFLQSALGSKWIIARFALTLASVAWTLHVGIDTWQAWVAIGIDDAVVGYAVVSNWLLWQSKRAQTGR